MHLDDSHLRDQGLAPPGGARGAVLVIACGALAREILALKALNGWDHLDLQCLPAKLHLWPDRIPDAVEAAVAEARGRYARDLRRLCRLRHRRAARRALRRARGRDDRGAALLQLLRRQRAFAGRGDAEMRAFYLTDFLVRQFDAFVWRPMGLDRHPELRDMLFGNYERLVYLAQTDDPALDAEAARCAERLGLAYERRVTGYGDLADALAGVDPSA